MTIESKKGVRRNPEDTFQLAVFSRKPVNSSDSGCD